MSKSVSKETILLKLSKLDIDQLLALKRELQLRTQSRNLTRLVNSIYTEANLLANRNITFKSRD